MKYIYLLLLILVLYYLFSNIYKKNSNQENFDPSLVPVSSIVTLAKVAQKLVDGGGTLTNPGNLQIGLPSAGALGNLYVTGTNTVDGNTAIKGTTSIDSLLTANGGISTTTIGATNNIAANSLSTTNGNVSINNGTINLTSDGTGGLYFLNSGTTASPVYNRLYMGPTNVTGDFNAKNNVTVDKNLNVTGNLTVNDTTTLKNHLSFVPPSSSTNEKYILYNAGDKPDVGGVVSNSLDMHTYQNDKWRTHALSIGNDGNVNLYNNLNVAGVMFDAAGQFRLVIQGSRAAGKCLTANPDDSINLQPCGTSDNQYWFRSGGRFISKSNKKCITITEDHDWNNDKTITKLMPIDPKNSYQVFSYIGTGNIVSNVLGGVNTVRTMWCKDDGTINWWTWGIGANGQWWMI